MKLTPAEREKRRAMLTKGSHAALCQRRARTLLLADEGRSDQGIAEALQVARTTVERTRRRCFEEGMEEALQRRPQRRPSKRPKLDGEKEAQPGRRPGLQPATRRPLAVELALTGGPDRGTQDRGQCLP